MFSSPTFLHKGHGWGFVVRNGDGQVRVTGVEQGRGILGPDLDEVRACIFSIKESMKLGLKSVILEEDGLTLITKLKNKDALAKKIGLFVGHLSLPFSSLGGWK